MVGQTVNGITIDVIVSRHQGLIEYLREFGFTDIPVLSHATPRDVKGKIVLGNLPLHLSSLARAIISPHIEVPPELRGKELSKDDLKKYLKGFKVYRVEYKGLLQLPERR